MSADPDYWSCFSADYPGARRKFRTAADALGAEVTAYVHPTAHGPAGEELVIDVARVGPRSASRILLMVSGTHGLEGAAGSAIQVAWLTSVGKTLPENVGVVLLHGLNPYGFAHTTRTTERNVDLNRNFIDHTAPPPENSRYAELHPHLVPDEWTETSLTAAADALERFRAVHGDDAWFNVLARGQYTHPEGVMYGGTERAWSNVTLQMIIDDHLHSAEKVAFIDWHTGIGDHGEPFFLCFHEENSPSQERAALWWGEDRVKGQRPHGLARPDYQGLVFHGVARFLGDRPMVGAVIEFGTRGRDTGLATRLDQWLRFKAPKSSRPDTERDAMLRADVIDALVPTSSVWRRSVIRHGCSITTQTIAGLADW
ncbi:M14 family metallopeptidase [Telmatospirillum siberiense]|uniref:DUF2817 domain-containing protein n=1 Tax=Telmatospirillum siberiense TaxID=382514 RepID=A0A2N3PNX1_9PROT|nr:M14 family metallopeptidase [Telmatospirillum siberiense]PKU22098.1 DUF2817 domain-containing protein [Telmatospirillum siberiense]